MNRAEKLCRGLYGVYCEQEACVKRLLEMYCVRAAFPSARGVAR